MTKKISSLNWFMFAALFFVAFSFVSCEKDEEGEDKGSVSKSDLFGTWQSTYQKGWVELNGKKIDGEEYETDHLTLTFYEDGVLESIEQYEESSYATTGTWSLAGNVLSVTDHEEESDSDQIGATYKVLKLTSTELVLFLLEEFVEDGVKYKACGEITLKKINSPNPRVDVENISLNKTQLAFSFVGDSGTLIPTIMPANATNKYVNWTSSNPDVAMVDNGVVTAVGEGTATITVTSVSGQKTATCAVTCNIEEEQPVMAANLIGMWAMIHSKGWEKENGIVVDSWDRDVEEEDWGITTFNNDGTFIDTWLYEDEVYSNEGTWSIKGDKLTLKYVNEENDEETVVTILKLTSSELVISFSYVDITYEGYQESTLHKITQKQASMLRSNINHISKKVERKSIWKGNLKTR